MKKWPFQFDWSQIFPLACSTGRLKKCICLNLTTNRSCKKEFISERPLQRALALTSKPVSFATTDRHHFVSLFSFDSFGLLGWVFFKTWSKPHLSHHRIVTKQSLGLCPILLPPNHWNRSMDQGVWNQSWPKKYAVYRDLALCHFAEAQFALCAPEPLKSIFKIIPPSILQLSLKCWTQMRQPQPLGAASGLDLSQHSHHSPRAWDLLTFYDNALGRAGLLALRWEMRSIPNIYR